MLLILANISDIKSTLFFLLHTGKIELRLDLKNQVKYISICTEEIASK